MPNPTRRRFLAATASGAAALAQTPATPTGGRLRLWYRQPAAEWAEALPVGNGRIGAMVFGGVSRERIQLNEDTLWSGAPKDWNNPEAKRFLPEVRKLVLQDRDYPAADEVCRKMQGPYNQSYQPLGNLNLHFDESETNGEYSRELDLAAAVARTQTGQVTREVFASAVDQVLIVRIEGARRLRVGLDSLLRSRVQADGAAGLRLSGKAPAHVDPNYKRSADPVVYDDTPGKGMYFECLLRAVADGGSVRAAGQELEISGAASVTLILAMSTGFRGYSQLPDTPAGEIAARCRKQLDAAARKPYTKLRADHVREHRRLFDRVQLSLGSQPDATPTDERLKNPDPSLLALYFHYGRYLLIASSRPGTQPANLQGIWSHEIRPPWSANWTSNINAQMNYWLAETCALSDCHQPLFDLIAELAVHGAVTAKVNYGLPGWVSHHNVDLWRQSAPVGEGSGSPTWANWQMSGPWFCQHLWEHYRFSRDREFLARRAYPLMKGAAEFCLEWLVEDPQAAPEAPGGRYLTTCPSFSTENVFTTAAGKRAQTSAGCSMDLALLRELFDNCARASEILGVDAAFRDRLRAARARLVPYRTGSRGQLLEWSEEFGEAEPGHRHMSHLYGLYPGWEITPRREPKLAQAARRSLELRLQAGGAYTGWSRAWAIGFWARLLDGDKAWESLVALMRVSTGNNLFDTHPAGAGKSIFQIDGNFGAAAAMAEMLLQSHEDEVAFLPALPAAWPDGEVQGIRTRCGVTLAHLRWSAGKAVSAELQSLRAGAVRLRPPAGQTIAAVQPPAGQLSPVAAAGRGEPVTVSLRAGIAYKVRFA